MGPLRGMAHHRGNINKAITKGPQCSISKPQCNTNKRPHRSRRRIADAWPVVWQCCVVVSCVRKDASVVWTAVNVPRNAAKPQYVVEVEYKKGADEELHSNTENVGKPRMRASLDGHIDEH